MTQFAYSNSQNARLEICMLEFHPLKDVEKVFFDLDISNIYFIQTSRIFFPFYHTPHISFFSDSHILQSLYILETLHEAVLDENCFALKITMIIAESIKTKKRLSKQLKCEVSHIKQLYDCMRKTIILASLNFSVQYF